MYRKVKNVKEFLFIVAGITFFVGIANRRVLREKSFWLATGWRITFVESALYGKAKMSEPQKWSTLSFP